MKKGLRFSLFILVVTILLAPALCTAKDLLRYTFNTYVAEEETDISLKGIVSVRGSDWIKSGNSWYYPKYSRISYYNKFGSKSAEATALGPDDNQTRVKYTYWNKRLDGYPEKNFNIGLTRRFDTDPEPEGGSLD